MNIDPYKVLGISKDATSDEIKTVYRNRCKASHPDHTNGNDSEIKALNEAYEILSDPEKRKLFDEFGVVYSSNSTEDRAQGILIQIFSEAMNSTNMISAFLNGVSQLEKQISAVESDLNSKLEILRNNKKLILDETFLGIISDGIKELELNINKVKLDKLTLDRIHEILKEDKFIKQTPQESNYSMLYKNIIGGLDASSTDGGSRWM